MLSERGLMFLSYCHKKWPETLVTKHQSFEIFALQKQMKAFYPRSSLFSISNDSATTVTP
jgi:hypothetical protein